MFRVFFTILLASSMAQAKVMFFACAWPEGSYVFAEYVTDKTELIKRTYKEGDTEITIKIKDFKKEGATSVWGDVSTLSERKIMARPTQCLVTQ